MIPVNWETIAAILAAIVLVGNAGEKIVKAWRAAKAPNDEQDRRIKALEDDMKTVKGLLGNDKRSLDKINSGLEASFQVQLALLDHALNGNNIKQMQDARDGLYDYLTHPNK